MKPKEWKRYYEAHRRLTVSHVSQRWAGCSASEGAFGREQDSSVCVLSASDGAAGGGRHLTVRGRAHTCLSQTSQISSDDIWSVTTVRLEENHHVLVLQLYPRTKNNNSKPLIMNRSDVTIVKFSSKPTSSSSSICQTFRTVIKNAI